MRLIFIIGCLFCLNSYGQLKDYTIGPKGDTLNGVDQQGKIQGKWVIRYDKVRGEAGYEEEGEYKNDRKEGVWRKYSLMGDLFGIETYRWGFKDGPSQYFNLNGELVKEENWRAFNPDKQYDTVQVEDPNNPDHFNTVIIKNDGSSLKNGPFKYYNPSTGVVIKTEFWRLGQLQDGDKPAGDATAVKKGSDSTAAAPGKGKPKEVVDFEKKNAGRKKVKVRDGSTGN
jgi:antitoxin component YwqK of YwqJK toxin-antitoxin module